MTRALQSSHEFLVETRLAASQQQIEVRFKEEVMESMMQGLVVLGGLTFSLAASLLIEELIFGRIVRVAFARRPTPSGVTKSGPRL